MASSMVQVLHTMLISGVEHALSWHDIHFPFMVAIIWLLVISLTQKSLKSRFKALTENSHSIMISCPKVWFLKIVLIHPLCILPLIGGQIVVCLLTEMHHAAYDAVHDPFISTKQSTLSSFEYVVQATVSFSCCSHSPLHPNQHYHNLSPYQKFDAKDHPPSASDPSCSGTPHLINTEQTSAPPCQHCNTNNDQRNNLVHQYETKSVSDIPEEIFDYALDVIFM